jgi:restriction system protein
MARRSSIGWAWGFVLVTGLVLVVSAVTAAVHWAEQHPEAARLIGFLAILAVMAAAGIVLRVRQRTAAFRAEQEARKAALERHISSADGLTGPQFERWFARLLDSSGFTRVEVCGGAGDLGADVIATSPRGHRTVFQCKRYGRTRKVPSGQVQQFAGTCRAIHRADIAAIVTTAGFSQPARDLARRLGIVLVDRAVLGAWAADHAPPDAFGGRSSPRESPRPVSPILRSAVVRGDEGTRG